MVQGQDMIELLVKLARNRLPPGERRRLERRLKGDSELAELYAVVRQLCSDAADMSWDQISDAVAQLSGRLVSALTAAIPTDASLSSA